MGREKLKTKVKFAGTNAERGDKACWRCYTENNAGHGHLEAGLKRKDCPSKKTGELFFQL